MNETPPAAPPPDATTVPNLPGWEAPTAPELPPDPEDIDPFRQEYMGEFMTGLIDLTEPKKPGA